MARRLRIGYPDPGTYSLVAAQGSEALTGRDATLTKASGSGDPLSLPLYNTSNIEYLGRFNLPTGDSDGGLGFRGTNPPQGGAGIAYNPSGNGGLGSLFVAALNTVGGVSNMRIAEVSLPTPKTSSPNTATFLQNFKNGCNGGQGTVETGQNGNIISSMQVDNGKLYVFVASMYQTVGGMTKMVFKWDSTNLSTATCVGPARVTSLNNRFIAASGCNIPANWQSTFGGYKNIIGGGGGLSIASNLSNGPTFTFCSLEDITGTNTINGVNAVYWEDPGTSPNPLGPYNPGAITDTWNGFSIHRGTVMFNDSRTVIAYGRHGDITYIGKPIATQCINRFWLFDAVDLKAAFDGTINGAGGDQCRPYAYYDMNIVMSEDSSADWNEPNGFNEAAGQTGLTFDPVNRIAYIIGQYDAGNYPAIHVVRFN